MPPAADKKHRTQPKPAGDQSSLDRIKREQLRQQKRMRQIRRRIAFAALSLVLVASLGVIGVLAMKNWDPGKSANSGASGQNFNQSQAGEEQPRQTDSSHEESQASPTENDFTQDLRELQGRIPDYVIQDFIPVNEFSRPCIALGQINNIVIHYVGNPGTTAAGNLSYFKQLADQTPGDKKATKASSNFIVGLEGEIIQCMPIYEEAYCSNWRNSDTLSIEVCHPGEDGKFNDTTYESLVNFCAWLCKELDLTEEDLIRHYDVTEKHCPKYYVENPEAWEQLKRDVGVALKALN